jgi:hypothetical protein
MKQLIAVAVVALAAAALAAPALADAPSPLSLSGTAVTNADGSRTLTVSGTYAWEKKCNPKKPDGYAIAWGDPTAPGNVVANGVAVGTPSDNAIHATNGCGDPGTFGPLSHTYPASVAAAIQVCAVTYHDKGHGKTAGGPNRQTDNSVEETEDGHATACFTFAPPPPPPPTDVCPNIQGLQTSVPAGMTKDASGNCITPTVVPSPPTVQTVTIEKVVVRTVIKKVVVKKKVAKAKKVKKVKKAKKTHVKGVQKKFTPRVLPHTR